MQGQVLGTARINPDRVRWDGQPSFAALLPAVAFDACLPTLGKDEQLRVLTEFEDWLDGCEAKVRRGEPPLLFNAALAEAELTVRIDRVRARVWSDARDLAVYKAVWDWLVTDGPRVVSNAELVRRWQSQRAHYRAHGIPSVRAIGRAPFAAWSDSGALAL